MTMQQGVTVRSSSMSDSNHAYASATGRIWPAHNTDCNNFTIHNLCQKRHVAWREIAKEIDCDPGCVQRPDGYGRPALYYAIKHRCAKEVIEVVYHAYPDALLLQDKCGESGLSLLYGPGFQSGILKLFLILNPVLSLHKSASFTGHRLVDTIVNRWSISKNLPCDDANGWEKVILTIEAAHRSVFTKETHISCRSFNPLLHLALELALPPSFLILLIRYAPEVAKVPMKNQNGMLPLHYVLHNPRYQRFKTIQLLVEVLLQAHPQSASLTHNDTLPLHIALSNGYEWSTGIRELMSGNPEASEHPCPHSGLLPYMITATQPSCDLSTVFSLFRDNPVTKI